jgi:alcohol dehydrogenase class IV
MGSPTSLAEVGIGDEKLAQLADQIVRDGKIGNYAKLGADELLSILKDAQS